MLQGSLGGHRRLMAKAATLTICSFKPIYSSRTSNHFFFHQLPRGAYVASPPFSPRNKTSLVDHLVAEVQFRPLRKEIAFGYSFSLGDREWQMLQVDCDLQAL